MLPVISKCSYTYAPAPKSPTDFVTNYAPICCQKMFYKLPWAWTWVRMLQPKGCGRGARAVQQPQDTRARSLTILYYKIPVLTGTWPHIVYYTILYDNIYLHVYIYI